MPGNVGISIEIPSDKRELLTIAKCGLNGVKIKTIHIFLCFQIYKPPRIIIDHGDNTQGNLRSIVADHDHYCTGASWGSDIW